MSGVAVGVFVFLFTLSGDPNFQLAFSCLEACFQQVMYGVLYAYTPEVIPAPKAFTGRAFFPAGKTIADVEQAVR